MDSPGIGLQGGECPLWISGQRWTAEIHRTRLELDLGVLSQEDPHRLRRAERASDRPPRKRKGVWGHDEPAGPVVLFLGWFSGLTHRLSYRQAALRHPPPLPGHALRFFFPVHDFRSAPEFFRLLVPWFLVVLPARRRILSLGATLMRPYLVERSGASPS